MGSEKVDERIKPLVELLGLEESLIGVEIGVLQGAHAIKMIKNLDIETLHLVDPFKAYYADESNRHVKQDEMDSYKKIAKETLMEHENKVVWHYKYSVDAAKDFEDNSLDFVYIDGDHLYEMVKKDILSWLPKLKKGKLMIGHDYDLPAVKRAVDEFCKKNKIKLHGESWGWYFKK